MVKREKEDGERERQTEKEKEERKNERLWGRERKKKER